MTQHTCAECGDALERPPEDHANYVRSDRFTEEREREVYIGLKHTNKTKKRLNKMDRLLPHKGRQEISAAMAHPDAPLKREVPAGTKTVKQGNTEVETARTKKFDFSIPLEDFDHVRVESPNIVQEDDDIAFVLVDTEQVEEQQPVLLCPECTDDDDIIIWGPDK